MMTNKTISALAALAALAVLIILLTPTPASAHKASVYGFSDAGRLYIEGYFFDGAPCKGCLVEVRAQKDGDVLVEGVTDDLGQLELVAPKSYPLYLKMAAGEGHAASFVLELPEPPEPVEPVAQTGFSDNTALAPCLENPENLEELDALVNAQVEARLEGMRKEISRLRKASERPGLTEVLGGIGYIIGLAGIWMYLRSKDRSKKENRDSDD